MTFLTKLKIATVLVVITLITTLVLQNTDAVETNIFWFVVALPRALLFALLFAVGVIVGLLLAYSLSSKRPDPD